jgi:hypothetical protein
MTRPLTNTVQYFFHSADASNGKTISILENRFGIQGYAFWFKLLELLANNENHFIDICDPLTFEDLKAKIKLPDDITANNYLSLLAKLLAINPELWEYGIIWSDNFVKGLESVYKHRKRDLPQKPVIANRNKINAANNPANVGIIDTSYPTRIGSIGNIGIKGSKDIAQRKKTPPVPLPECVSIYRDVFNYSLNSASRAEVESIVGNNGNLVLWREILTEWALRGWNPKNIKGMIDCFKKVKIEDKKQIYKTPAGKQTQAEKFAVIDNFVKKVEQVKEKNVTLEADKLNG